MSTDIVDTPLFAEIAGEDTERVLALVDGTTHPLAIEELLARHPQRDQQQLRTVS